MVGAPHLPDLHAGKSPIGIAVERVVQALVERTRIEHSNPVRVYEGMVFQRKK